MSTFAASLELCIIYVLAQAHCMKQDKNEIIKNKDNAEIISLIHEFIYYDMLAQFFWWPKKMHSIFFLF